MRMARTAKVNIVCPQASPAARIPTNGGSFIFEHSPPSNKPPRHIKAIDVRKSIPFLPAERKKPTLRKNKFAEVISFVKSGLWTNPKGELHSFFILTPFIPEVKTFLSCKKNFNVTAFGFSFIYWI